MGQDEEHDPLVGRSPRGILLWGVLIYLRSELYLWNWTIEIGIKVHFAKKKKKKRKEEEEEMTLYLTHSYKLNPNNTSQPLR